MYWTSFPIVYYDSVRGVHMTAIYVFTLTGFPRQPWTQDWPWILEPAKKYLNCLEGEKKALKSWEFSWSQSDVWNVYCHVSI